MGEYYYLIFRGHDIICDDEFNSFINNNNFEYDKTSIIIIYKCTKCKLFLNNCSCINKAYNIKKPNNRLNNIISGYNELILLNYNNTVFNIPESISSLKIMTDFNKKYKINNIPKTIKKICFKNLSQKQINNLPSHIKYFTLLHGITIFGHDYLFNMLPNTIEYLIINTNSNYNYLPSSIELFNLNSNYYQYHCVLNLNALILPNQLKHFKTGDNFNKKIAKLPCGLLMLSLGNNFNKEIVKLPCGLLTLSLGQSFNKKIDENKLPKTLKKLIIPNIGKFGGKRLSKNLRQKKVLNKETRFIEIIF